MHDFEFFKISLKKEPDPKHHLSIPSTDTTRPAEFLQHLGFFALDSSISNFLCLLHRLRRSLGYLGLGYGELINK